MEDELGQEIPDPIRHQLRHSGFVVWGLYSVFVLLGPEERRWMMILSAGILCLLTLGIAFYLIRNIVVTLIRMING
jgi:cytosine/uracil/thiamine/allantoin permease